MKSIKLLSIFLISLQIASAETVVRIHGSSTTAKMLQPYSDAIAAAHGVKLEYVTNGTGHGVSDLAEGKADVAMVTGSVDYFADLQNTKSPGSLLGARVKIFQLKDIPTAAAVIIVHPGNGVKSLTKQQIHDLFSGVITNWKELGGIDAPVQPILPDAFDGIGSVLTVKVMAGTAYAANCQHVVLATDLGKVVAETPGGIAFLSRANASANGDKVKIVTTVPAIIPPNYLIVYGEPTKEMRTLLNDFQEKIQ